MIGRQRQVPEAEASEYMRRHVLGVRRVRRGLGISFCDVQCQVREAREVVAVNQVVHDAGVPGFVIPDPVQQRGRLEGIGIGLVPGILRGQ